MEEFSAGPLLNAISGLLNFAKDKENSMGVLLPVENLEEQKRSIDLICAELRRMDFGTSLVAANQLRSIIFDESRLLSEHPEIAPNVTADGFSRDEMAAFEALAARRFAAHISHLAVSFRNEGAARVALSVNYSDTYLYRQPEPLFGVQVRDKFPSLIYDIEEAGKCLALERSTASAFHSIRCLEAVIRAVSRSLGLPDPTRGADRNWSRILGKIKDEIERRWPSSTGRMSGDAKFFDEVYGALSGMQNPYRNSTMHLDDKYTQHEARHLFEIVRGFISSVASRLDEDGLPLA